MSDDPLDTLLIRAIAQKEILRHLIIKLARQSDDPKAWVFDLHEEISTARGIVQLSAPPSQDRRDMARDVSREVEKLFNEIDLDKV